MPFVSVFFQPQKRGEVGGTSLSGRKIHLSHHTLLMTEFCALSPSAGSSGVDLCHMKPGLTRAPKMSPEAITPTPSTHADPKTHRQNANEVPKLLKGGKADLLTSISHRETIGGIQVIYVVIQMEGLLGGVLVGVV